MTRTLFALAAIAALTAGCQKQGADAGDFDISMPTSELMGHVIDPAAWAYWDRSGEYMAEDGSWVTRVPARPDSVPEDPNSLDDDVRRDELAAEWHRAIDGAAILVEAGNMLQLPGRVRTVENNDNGDWVKFSKALTAKAHEAMEAAEAYDGEGLFTLGGELYQICRDCHDKYLVPFLDPETGELPKGVGPEGEPLKE